MPPAMFSTADYPFVPQLPLRVTERDGGERASTHVPVRALW